MDLKNVRRFLCFSLYGAAYQEIQRFLLSAVSEIHLKESYHNRMNIRNKFSQGLRLSIADRIIKCVFKFLIFFPSKTRF